MWFRLMDEQEVCGLGVDVCACAERMEKSLSRRLKFFFSSLSNHREHVCVCVWSCTCVRTPPRMVASVCALILTLRLVDSCETKQSMLQPHAAVAETRCSFH